MIITSVIGAGVLGMLAGSFLNAWICRMEARESILKVRSRCPKCGKKLNFLELLPVISYLAQKGRCRACRWRIPIQYLLVELVSGFLFGFIAWRYGFGEAGFGAEGCLLFLGSCLPWAAFRDMLFVSPLIVLFIFDLKHGLIPDRVVLPAAVLAVILNFFAGQPILYLLLAMGAGGGFFLIQYAVSRGKWIGAGDIRLGVMMGAMLGWPLIAIGIFVSYILGSVVSLGLVATRKAVWKGAIPLGTFLSVGTAITLWWGKDILSWYFNLSRF